MIIPFMIFNQNNKIVGGSRSLDLETTYLSLTLIIVKETTFH
jgi:hypothetical protein